MLPIVKGGEILLSEFRAIATQAPDVAQNIIQCCAGRWGIPPCEAGENHLPMGFNDFVVMEPNISPICSDASTFCGDSFSPSVLDFLVFDFHFWFFYLVFLFCFGEDSPHRWRQDSKCKKKQNLFVKKKFLSFCRAVLTSFRTSMQKIMRKCLFPLSLSVSFEQGKVRSAPENAAHP